MRREPVGDRRELGTGRHQSQPGGVLAEADGAEAVIFGPVWETPSHPGSTPVGLEAVRSLAQNSRIPVIAIGGVTRERVPEVMAICAGYAAIGLFR